MVRWRQIGRIACLAWAAVGAMALDGCSKNEVESLEPPTTVPDVRPALVRETFQLTIDPKSPSLARPTLAPSADPLKITGGSQLRLTAFAKRLAARPGILWIELYVENTHALGLAAMRASMRDLSANALYDFTNDPFAEPTVARTIDLGGVGPEGIARFSIGVPDGDVTTMTLDIGGTTTARTSTASSPIVVTPDGKEAWAALGDFDALAVIDTASDTRIASIPLEGHPSSLAVTPDGAFVLVTEPTINRLSIIDRRARKVVQTFGEFDGLGREPRHVVVTPDGGRAFVSAYVGDAITSFVRNGDHFRLERTLDIGRRPAGLSVSPDSKTLFVTHFLPRGPILANEGWVSVVAIESLTETRQIAVLDSLNLDRAHCLADVFGVSAQRLTTEGTATQLAGLFLNPGGSEGWTPGARIAPAPIFEKGPKSISLSAAADVRPGEFAAALYFLFDTRVPAEADRMLSPGAVERPVPLSYLQCERFQLEMEIVDREMIPGKPTEQVARFPAFPTYVDGLSGAGVSRFVAFSRGGRRALMLAYASDDLVVYDAATKHPVTQRHFTLDGSQPLGLALTPDGRKGYVVYESSTFVSALDLSAYAEPGKLPTPSFVPYEFRDVPELPRGGNGITNQQLVRDVAGIPERPAITEVAKIKVVDVDPLDPILRRGRILFESSNPDKYPKLTASPLGACVTCHPDGGTDGSMWGTMEGERRTMSLRGGVMGRGWLHASATHASADEFVRTIVHERLGGDLPEDDVQAMAKWVAVGIPRLQGPKVDDLLVARGKKVFADKCSACHYGAQYTSGEPDPTSPLGGGDPKGEPMLYDIGTKTDNAHVILGTFFESLFPAGDAEIFHGLRGDRELGSKDPMQQKLDFRPRPDRDAGMFKAPSLVDTWDNVVFFHDGRFSSMEEVVHFKNVQQELEMTAADERAVVELMKTF